MNYSRTEYKNVSYNTIHPLGDPVAAQAKHEQSGCDPKEPREVAFILLPRDPDVHSPETGNDIHRQDDGSEHGELAEDVCGLLLSLVHADVDLGEVVAMRSG